jgi:thioredoxin reductase/ferredoxin
MTALVVGGLVAATLLVYLLWGVAERRKEHRARAVARGTEALGDDVVPVSIHPKIDPSVCIGSGACVKACPEKDVIALVDGQARLVNPLACVGHGACAAACPVHAIELVFGTARRGVELPAVGPDFQTNLPGVYVAGELGGMGLIRNAVEQGKQAARYLVASPRRGGAGALDAIVIGAGPAGISATLQLVQDGMRVVLLEQEAFGGTIRHYPRAKVVMTGTLDVPGYGKVRRRTMTKEALVELWEEIRVRTALPVETGVRVEAIRPGEAGDWIVSGAWGEKRAANVVLALGRRGAPRRLGVPGEELDKVHYRLLEPDVFRGRHVLVVGGGNAAADCVLALVEGGACASVSLSYRRAEMARLRAPVRERLDAAVRQDRLRALLPTEVKAISPRDVSLARPDGSGLTLANDAVIVQIGGTSPADVLSAFGVATVTKRGEA